jgi:hypothetical protein
MALHFRCSPLDPDEDQVLDYLQHLKNQTTKPSQSYFKHTVYGLSSAVKKQLIPDLQQQTGTSELPQKTKIKHRICPICRKGELIILAVIKARGPPLSSFIQRLSIPA